MQSLIAQTCARFGFSSEEEGKIFPIEKGGSGRYFYRLEIAGRALIIVKYTDARPENLHFVCIAQFLKKLDIRVPKIFLHDENEGLIWMEDLGKDDLWNYRPCCLPSSTGCKADDTNPSLGWSERRLYYQSALQEVWRLHDRGWKGMTTVQPRPVMQKEFNAAMYQWEQNYFFEYCLETYFELDAQKVNSIKQLPAWNHISHHLSTRPRVLVHRDLQSQNVIIQNHAAYLIDFQGLRPGLAHYDLASLLYDPYAQLPEAEREELLDYYLSLGRRPDLEVDREAFLATYRFCALQRLMQALGAYGFLGIKKNKPEFLNYIPIALGSLKQTVAAIPMLDTLGSLLEETATAKRYA